LARPNHNIEKRQREIAKQKKKDEKRQRKLDRASGTNEDGTPVAPENTAPEEPAP
jgi:hypothetical protein